MPTPTDYQLHNCIEWNRDRLDHAMREVNCSGITGWNARRNAKRYAQNIEQLEGQLQ